MTREDAIKKIKEAMPTLWKETKDAIQILIPELKENEDERIRKALVKTFEKKLENGFEWTVFGIPNRAVLDWLEKQKDIESKKDKFVDETMEMKDEIDEGFTKFMEKAQKQKPTEWSEEDEKMVDIAEQCATNRDFTFSTIDEQVSFLSWLKYLRSRALGIHWKPTKEQMNKLSFAIKLYIDDLGEAAAKPLEDLYEELKKL